MAFLLTKNQCILYNECFQCHNKTNVKNMNTPDLNFVQFNVILKEIWSPLQLIAANKSIGIN